MAKNTAVGDANFKVVLDRDNKWGKTYSGPRNKLIEDGLAADGQFPGDVGCPGTTAYTFERDSRKINIRRRVRDIFWLHIGITKEERRRQMSDKRTVLNANEQSEHADAGAEQETDDLYRPVIDEDSEWPPAVGHNPRIERGSGDPWHYLGEPDVLVLEGLLEPDEVPGHPKCDKKYHYFGGTDGLYFLATKLGKRVAVTILGAGSGLGHFVPHRFSVR